MYCILSLVLFLGAVLNLNQTGDFDQFFKLCILSGVFGLCDSISSLSIKKFIDAVSNYKPIQKDENKQK